MGWACDTYSGGESCVWGFAGKNVRERDHLEDLSENGRIILEIIFKEWNGSMDMIDLLKDKEKWRALVKAIMNIRAP